MIEVFGAKIRWLEQGKQTFPFPTDCEPLPGITFRSPQNGLALISWRGPSLVLGGLEVSDLATKAPEFMVLFDKPTALTEPELYFFLTPHGYVQVRTQICLESIANGLPTQEIVFSPTTANFGSLEISISIDETATTRLAKDAPLNGLLGRIALTQDGLSYDSGYLLTLREPIPSPFRFASVPFGSYSLVFTPENELFTCDVKSVVIDGSARRANLDLCSLDGKKFGALRLDVTDEHGAPFTETLQVQLYPQNPTSHMRQRGFMVFRHSPYVIPMIPEGTFEIEIGRGAEILRGRGNRTTTVIRNSEITTERISLAPAQR
jgi:hypothetical protein